MILRVGSGTNPRTSKPDSKAYRGTRNLYEKSSEITVGLWKIMKEFVFAVYITSKHIQLKAVTDDIYKPCQ